MTREERKYLEMYKPETYALELPRELGHSLEDKGWVRWVAPMFGSSRLYEITEAGRRALEGQ